MTFPACSCNVSHNKLWLTDLSPMDKKLLQDMSNESKFKSAIIVSIGSTTSWLLLTFKDRRFVSCPRLHGRELRLLLLSFTFTRDFIVPNAIGRHDRMLLLKSKVTNLLVRQIFDGSRVNRFEDKFRVLKHVNRSKEKSSFCNLFCDKLSSTSCLNARMRTSNRIK